MELRHLRCFQAVARQLNFSRAASELQVSQPALSRQLKALEEELGVCLLDRNRQRVYLTDEGRAMLRYTNKVLADVDIAVAAAHGLAEGRGGELVVGHDWRIAFSFIPDTLAEFRHVVPQAEVSLRELPLNLQAAALKAHKIHLGFIPRTLISRHAEFDRVTVLNSEYVVAVPASHPLARRRWVPLAALENETWLTVEDAPRAYRTHLTQLCRLAGFSPIFSQRVAANVEGMRTMIAAGYGIALGPRFIMERCSRSIRLLKTDCEPIEICAVWLRASKSRLLQQYLAILRRHIGVTNGVRT